MQDAYVNLGFSWLVGGAGLGLQAALGRITPATVEAAGPVWRWGTAELAGYIKSVRLPAGVKIPAVVLNTPRPVYQQEMSKSCGPACVKMVTETILRKSLPEEVYRTMCQTEVEIGTGVEKAAIAMRKVGLNAKVERQQRLQDLAAATENGYPAILHMGPAQDGHALIVDAVVKDLAGNAFVIARDPWNLSKMSAELQSAYKAEKYSNYPVITAEDFLGKGGWSGTAIYTKPKDTHGSAYRMLWPETMTELREPATAACDYHDHRIPACDLSLARLP
jgi:hypothetical protein